jgi:hypothetical protein
MGGRILAMIAAAVLLAACSTGGPRRDEVTATLPDTSPASSAEPTQETTTSEETTSSETTPAVKPALLAPGAGTTIEAASIDSDASGTFTLTVGKPIAVAEQPDNHTLWLGLQVTVSEVADTPVVAADNFGLSPVHDPSYGDKAAGGELLGEDSLIRTACKGIPQLEDALAAAGMLNDDISGMDLTSGLRKTTGCVVFYYGHTDHPTRVSYYPQGLDDTTVAPTLWSVTLPGSARKPPSGIVYRVTSDGGISSVTYATAGFNQAQDTSVSGGTWSKTIRDAGVDVATVVAQAGGGASTIRCSITVDGQQLAKETSHGQYAVVTCSAQP